MATKVLPATDIYEIYKAEYIAKGGQITDFNAGSQNDIENGALSTAINESMELTTAEFLKTFFGSAKGADLEFLAIDHFGERFARPKGAPSTVELVFSRPNTDAGDLLIPASTVVKTVKDANGIEYRFLTDQDATMTGLTISINATSDINGTNTRVAAATLTVLENSLTDPSITVTNPSAAAGGTNPATDPEYRDFIADLLDSLAGATEDAIRGAVEAIPEIGYVSIVTENIRVRPVDSGGTPIGAAFFIPYVKVYVADTSGNFSPELIAKAEAAILEVRGAGVKIEVIGALSVAVDWTANMTLNPSGPNYAQLQTDKSPIETDMRNYIDINLPIGSGFDRIIARDYILAIWGPDGTNDITSFVTLTPTGNIAGQVGTKLISENVGIV